MKHWLLSKLYSLPALNPCDVGKWELTEAMVCEDEGGAVETSAMSSPIDVEMLDNLEEATDDVQLDDDVQHDDVTVNDILCYDVPLRSMALTTPEKQRDTEASSP